MPASVKPSEEYLWRRAKSRAKAAGHEGDFDFIMTIFQRMRKSLAKSFTLSVGAEPGMRRSREPGQVPTQAALARLEALTAKPGPTTLAQITAYDEPVMTPEAVVKGLGFDAAELNSWTVFVRQLAAGAGNEVQFRQQLLGKARAESLESESSRAILQRGLTYFRGLRKSVVEVVSVTDELSKSGPRGGQYYRRTPNPSGKGYRYFYDKDDYDKHAGAHTKGEDAEASYISAQVSKCLEASGTEGCAPSALKTLVQKYGSAKIAQALKGRAVVKKGKIHVQSDPPKDKTKTR